MSETKFINNENIENIGKRSYPTIPVSKSQMNLKMSESTFTNNDNFENT